MRVGVILVVSSACLMFLPAVIDLRPLSKYVVAFALIAALIGLGCIANGAVDLLRSRGLGVSPERAGETPKPRR